MIWSILFGMLSLLLTWWLNKKESGSPPNARDVRLTNRLISYVEKIKAAAVPLGCSPTGSDEPIEEESHPLVSAMQTDVDSGFGWNPLDRIYSIIGEKAANRIRQLFPDLWGLPEDQNAFITAEVKRIAES